MKTITQILIAFGLLLAFHIAFGERVHAQTVTKDVEVASGYNTTAIYRGDFFVCDSKELMELYLENIFVGGMSSEESLEDLGTKEGGKPVCGTNEWIFKFVGEVARLPDIGDGYVINHVLVYGFIVDGFPIRILVPIDGYGYDLIE